MTAQLRAVGDDEQVPAGGPFSAHDLIALTGVTYRQLDWWCRCGFLPETARGSGSQRTFTAGHVDAVRAVVALLALGVELRAAWRIADTLIEQGRWASTSGQVLITVVAPACAP